MSSCEPSGRCTRTPLTRAPADSSLNSSVAVASVNTSTLVRATAADKAPINSLPVRFGVPCIRLTLWPGYKKLSTSDNGTRCASISQSIVRADSRANDSAMPASVRPRDFFMMSAANNSAQSLIPRSRCRRVSAPGIRPVDIAVLPSADASRSSTSASAPAPLAASAAVRPQPPPPIMSTGACAEKFASRLCRTPDANMPPD